MLNKCCVIHHVDGGGGQGWDRLEEIIMENLAPHIHRQRMVIEFRRLGWITEGMILHISPAWLRRSA